MKHPNTGSHAHASVRGRAARYGNRTSAAGAAAFADHRGRCHTDDVVVLPRPRDTFQADDGRRHRGRLSAAGLLADSMRGMVRRPGVAMLYEGAAGAGLVGPSPHLAGTGEAVPRPAEPQLPVRARTRVRLDLHGDIAACLNLNTARAIAPRHTCPLRPVRSHTHLDARPAREPFPHARTAHRAGRVRRERRVGRSLA